MIITCKSAHKLTHQALKNALIPLEREIGANFVFVLLRLDGIKLRMRKEVNGTGLGALPHSAAYPHLVSGRSFALGDITKVRRKE